MSHLTQFAVIAFRNLLQHTRRTALLGGAIWGVSALLALLLCLSSGVRATMLQSATTLMTGHINVAGFYKVTAGQSAPLVTNYKKVEEVVRKALSDIDYIVARGRGWARVVGEQGSIQSGIGAIDIEHEPGFRKTIKVIDGKLEDLAKPNTILIFAEQAKKLGVKAGDPLIISAMTQRGVNNTIDVHVAAIAQDVGLLSGFNVFVPTASLEQLYQLNPDSTGNLLVYLKDMKKVPKDMEILRQALTDAGYRLMDHNPKAFWFKFDLINREDWTGQKLDLTTWEDEISFIKWTITALDGLMYVLTVVLLVIIAVGIMNSMWIAIRERTREIGTLRAIGMQRRGVLIMFVLEAFMLGAAGTLAGSLTGVGLSGLLSLAHLSVPKGAQLFLMSSTLKFAYDWPRIFSGMAVITACTTLISIIPSTHAARLKPITAMQHIG